jgi:YegS/Rv2252/BmrU family lipid kinase
MKPLLIVNPRAGGGRTGETFDAMREVITRAIGEHDVELTERSGHASDLAHRAALDGRETVVAVGGDGSIHEVVSGLMRAKAEGAGATRLGVIGQGTGGDFRKSLGIEHRLDRYCSAISCGHTRAVDVGRFSAATEDGDEEIHGYFINILSVGLGGLVDRYVAEGNNRFGGTFAYFTASARALLESSVGVLACTIHEGSRVREQEIPTRSMAICNGRFFGSGMEIAPMARLDDGLFEVVDLGSAGRLKFAAVSSQVYSGRHIDHPDVQHFRCDRITMELLNKDVRDRFLLDIDGEPLGRMPLTIEVMPSALEVFVP